MVDEKRDDQEIDEQQELERALALLRPAASGIDRDSFLFLAGRASAEAAWSKTALGRWTWPAATLISSLAAALMLVLLVTRMGREANRAEMLEARRHEAAAPAVTHVAKESTVETHARAVEDVAPPAPTAEEAALALGAESNYPRLRSFVLAYGIDALPEPAPIRDSRSAAQSDEEPVTVKDLLRQTLNGRSAG
jgi:hypothetical protein